MPPKAPDRGTWYHELEGFDGFYLEDSYLLGTQESHDAIAFGLLAVLTELHPAYRAPGPEEAHCYRDARLVFSGCTHLRWRRRDFKPIQDPDGSMDYGNIDAFFLADGVYHLSGEWGEVEIEAEVCRIDLAPGS